MKTILLKSRFIEAVKAKDAANIYRFRDLLKVARVADDIIYEWIGKATEQKVSNEELDKLTRQGELLHREKNIGNF